MAESPSGTWYWLRQGQPLIMGTKVGQKHVQKQIEAFVMFDHHPEGMEIDSRQRINYKQFDLEYQIESRRDKAKQADCLN